MMGIMIFITVFVKKIFSHLKLLLKDFAQKAARKKRRFPFGTSLKGSLKLKRGGILLTVWTVPCEIQIFVTFYAVFENQGVCVSFRKSPRMA